MPGATFKLALAYAAFAVRVADGAMSIAAGQNPRRLTSATAAFTVQDVGKKIVVEGAGLSGADLSTHIRSYESATKVILDDPALTTVTGSDISYVKGVYRVSQVLQGADIDGNHYQVDVVRRLQIMLSADSPGGSLFIGGPYLTTANYGIQLEGGSSDTTIPLTIALPLATFDYITSDTADQLVHIYWIDDFNRSTPA